MAGNSENRKWVGWLISALGALLVAGLFTAYELSSYDYSTVLLMHALADGFFAAAVLYLGFGLLMLIAEAGNFYGISYLMYSLIATFSPRRRDAARRKKDYFTYCLEKEEKKKDGKSGLERYRGILLGAGALVISLFFTWMFYRV